MGVGGALLLELRLLVLLRLLLRILVGLLLGVFLGLLLGVLFRFFLGLLLLGVRRAEAPCAVGSADLAVVGGGREVDDLLAGQGLAHEFGEQVGRVAGGRDAVSGEFGHDLRAAVVARVPDRPHVEQLRHVADERGCGLVVGGTRLAGHRTAERRRGARRGAVRRGALHRLLHQRAVVRVEHLLVLDGGLVHLVALAVVDRGDDVQRVLDAVGRDRRVALRQIPHGARVDAEHVVRRIRVDVARDAGLVGDGGRALRRQMLVDVHEHGVHRVCGGLVQVDVAPVVVQRVVHDLADAVEMLAGVAVEHRVEVHALLGRAEQRERLHRGARLELGLRGVVELVRQVIRTAVYGFDGAVARVEGDAADLDALGHAVRARVADGLHLVLHGLVDRGDDLVSAGLEVVLGEGARVDQLVLHGGEQIAVRPAVHVVLRVFDGGGQRFGLRLLVGGDVPVLLHDAQHALHALRRHVGVLRRVPGGGGGDDAGDGRGLGQAQVLGVLAEIRLRGGLDAVRPAAQVDRVHVVAQHFALILLLRDLHREDGLAELAGVAGRFAQIVAFRVLLGDGRPALARALGDVVDERAGDALEIDAPVRVERAVLGGHDRLAHIVG